MNKHPHSVKEVDEVDYSLLSDAIVQVIFIFL